VTVDVRVRRCVLTIRRRDGWSWGAGPQPHLDAALAGVEAAVEAAVAEAGVATDVDAHLDQPVRLEVASDGVVTAASWNALVERLRAVPVDEPEAPVEPRPQDVAVAGAPGDGDKAPDVDVADEHAAGALARTLARWSRGGQMARVVSAWPATLVRAWIEAIASAARHSGPAAAPAPLTAEAVDLIAEGVLGASLPDPSGRETADRMLVLLAAIIAALGDRLPDGATQALARQRVAADDEPVAVAPRTAASQPGTPSASRTRGASATRQPRTPAEQVVPALPLLVLAQLSRIGYVDAILSAVVAAGLSHGAGALGAAVAGKVLSPPGRGWRRERADAAAVALASGGPAEQLPEALGALGAREQELVAPLASALQAAYAEGRSADDELLVWAGDEGIVCGEEEGLLPAAWVASEPELDAVLASLGRPPVRRGAGFEALARALHGRPGLPRTDAPALERQLGAAAGTALGLIAVNLWGAAGQATTPLLALERLGDLEARIRRGRDGLLVSIPRGQRWFDLRRGGLLELFAIPWLHAGRLEIGTW